MDFRMGERQTAQWGFWRECGIFMTFGEKNA
jgi:hypothetical protein